MIYIYIYIYIYMCVCVCVCVINIRVSTWILNDICVCVERETQKIKLFWGIVSTI